MSTSPLPADPYAALNVAKDADEGTIKKAHRKLVLQHHPDRIKDPALVEQAKDEFQKVQSAYELLIDPVRRQRYDDEVKLAQLQKERMQSRGSHDYFDPYPQPYREPYRDRENYREAPREYRREPPPPQPMRQPTYTRTTYQATPRPGPTYAMPRETPIPRSTPREERQPEYVTEDREPSYPSYFDIPSSSSRYEDALPKSHTRKSQEPAYERRGSAHKVPERKEEKRSKAPSMHTAATASRFVNQLKKNVEASREKKKVEKEQEKVHRREDQKTRDRDEKRNREAKEAYSRYSPRVDDYMSEASSESDVPVYKSRAQPRERSPAAMPKPTRRSLTPEPQRQRVHPSPRARQPSPMRRGESYKYFEDDGYDSPISEHEGKWENHHGIAQQYMQEATQKVRSNLRPGPPSRQNSANNDKFWTKSAQPDLRDNKRSGSDSDRARPSASRKESSRRSAPPEEQHIRPPLPTQQSAPPAGLKKTMNMSDDFESLPKSRQNSYDGAKLGSHRRNLSDKGHPTLSRSASDQIPRTGSKRDNVPIRGSTLKQTETHFHDSAYSSGSSPHSPEVREESRSPPRDSREAERQRERELDEERAPRPPLRESRTTYRAKKDVDLDGAHRATKVPDRHEKQAKPEKIPDDHRKQFMPTDDSDGGPIRQFLSPEDIPAQREREAGRERHRSRSQEAHHRSSSNQPANERRPSLTRDNSSSRPEKTKSKGLFHEILPERRRARSPEPRRRSPDRRQPERSASYMRKVDHEKAKYADHNQKTPMFSNINYGKGGYDSPPMQARSRRPSVY